MIPLILKVSIKKLQQKMIGRKTCGMIQQWIDINVIHHVAWKQWNISSSKSLKIYLSGIIDMACLLKRLTTISYSDGQNDSDHLSKFQEMLNHLAKAEIMLNDEIQALILANTLPGSLGDFEIFSCQLDYKIILSLRITFD